MQVGYRVEPFTKNGIGLLNMDKPNTMWSIYKVTEGVYDYLQTIESEGDEKEQQSVPSIIDRK